MPRAYDPPPPRPLPPLSPLVPQEQPPPPVPFAGKIVPAASAGEGRVGDPVGARPLHRGVVGGVGEGLDMRTVVARAMQRMEPRGRKL